MRKYLFIPLFLVACVASARNGSIPTYSAFVRWIQGNDTVYHENNNILLESCSPDGTVTIRVRHEEWDNSVSEKRQELLQPWHGTMSAFKGIRAIIPAGKSNTDAMMLMHKSMEKTQNALAIDMLSRMTDQLDMNLNSQYMVENSSNREIVVNDLNRGLVWYIPPKSYLIIDAGRLPYACLLRIANTDPLQPAVKYATIGSGCFSMKYTVAYEDEDCWIYTAGQEITVRSSENDFTYAIGLKDTGIKSVYIYLDKNTFMETEMTENEVLSFIKKHKKK